MIERLHIEKTSHFSGTEKHSVPEMALPVTEPIAGIRRQESFPLPLCARVKMAGKERKMPQTIAHRGFKTEHPENTMRAFRAAVEDGSAHAIETDIHLSKDDVVVLSHDADLKRCFGDKKKIVNCEWSYLSQLRTVKAPHEPMPRLRDLLDYISQPGLEGIWLLLDIKLDNDADKVMRLIADTLDAAEPGQIEWRRRVVLGVWAAKYLPLCVKYLPGYPVTHIGFSSCYARNFLQVPNVSFNMFQKALIGPVGTRFLQDAKAAGRPVFVWTVDDVHAMKWCIRQELDGVITNNPKLFNKVCREWTENDTDGNITFFQWLYSFWLVYVVLAIMAFPFRRKFPETVEGFLRSEELRAKASMALDS